MASGADRVLAIVNPAARAGRGRQLWTRVEPFLRDGFGGRMDVSLTPAPGAAVELAERAARDGYAAILAAGGDGTLHEVVNGVLAAGTGTPVGVVPIGTGNDFARGVGLPRDPLAVARLLPSARPRAVDVGQVETAGSRRCFVNVGGVGFDAEVAARVAGAGKRMGGALPYVLGVLRTLAGYRNAPLSVSVDGEEQHLTALLVAVGVAPYTAGGMHMLPGADLGDGLLDVLVAGDVSRLEVLALLPRVFRGTHVLHPKVRCARGREVRVRGPEVLHVYADGEVLGRLPAAFRCLPGALRVLVPS